MPTERLKTGEQLGSFNKTLAISDANECGVSKRISPQNIDLTEGEEYIIQLFLHKGRNGKEFITDFVTTYHGSQISIPKEEILKHELLEPGRTVIVKIFKRPAWSKEQLSDNARVIDRVNVRTDPSQQDKCDSRLNSTKVAQHLDEAEHSYLKYRNLRTNKEAVGESHSDYSTEPGAFSFPFETRREIKAEPDDYVEIISVPNNEIDNITLENTDKDVEELIREMHSMMMEMYNDYLEHKND